MKFTLLQKNGSICTYEPLSMLLVILACSVQWHRTRAAAWSCWSLSGSRTFYWWRKSSFAIKRDRNHRNKRMRSAKWTACVFYWCDVHVHYSGTLLYEHLSTADIHDIPDNSESPDCPSIDFHTLPLNSGLPTTPYNGQFPQSQL